MKHRAGSSKIKYEHTMIQGLREFLEKQLEPLDYVEAIFPGEIKRTKGISSGFKIRFKYATKTGVKLLAYAPSVVQEVFVVTKDPEALRRFIEEKEDS
ncbi:metal-binding protein [bacterium]|nr:metal-binding protein [bacterium]